MKSRLIAAAALAALLLALPASAETAHARDAKASQEKDVEPKAAPAEGSQQHKMKVCNVEAGKKNLKGDERRAFMSSCLKG